MKNRIFKRLLSIMLCLVMAVGCLVVPTSAVFLDSFATIVGAASALLQFAQMCSSTPDRMMKAIWNEINNESGGSWTGGSSRLANDSTRAETSPEVLGYLAYDWNQNYVNAGIDFPCTTVTLRGSDGAEWTVIRLLPYGPAGSNLDKNNKQWFLCDGQGRILCSSGRSTAGSWISKSSMKWTFHMLSLEGLYDMAKAEGGYLRSHDGLFVIENNAGTQVLVASDGLAYAAWDRDDQAAVNQDRPTSSGTVTDSSGTASSLGGGGSSNIDLNNGSVSFPDGAIQQIGNVIYDQSTKTYYVDSRDYSTTYNQAFSFFQYHINYTSVTYIGQTEEYNKYYEAYYELPDGRDSADLTKEDLEQLSTTFADVVNYARSTDNVDQRVLYHFDGDTQDASYWSYTTSFDWATGASLTYMDEGVFSGSLYLDETEHDFIISLPGNDAAGDFTLQFRYYQSYTAAPQTDSWIQVGDEKLLSFSGAMYLDKNGAGIVATSIGTWNEICIIRSDNVLYYYVNGVFYKSVADNTYHKPTLRFYFGDDQQTYKKLDELRFTKSVVYTAGEDYTVSSVPFDSSLSLILPDGERPMADEVLVITPSENNLLTEKGLADWTNADTAGLVKAAVVPSSWSTQQYNGVGIQLYSNPTYTTLTPGDGFIGLSVAGSPATYKWTNHNYSYGNDQWMLANGLYLPIMGYSTDQDEESEWYTSSYANFTAATDYTITVVLADGTTSSATFKYASAYSAPVISSKSVGSVVDFDIVDIKSTSDGYWTAYMHRYGLRIFTPQDLTADIVHMEIVLGTEPEVNLSWESAVYPASKLEDSPVLAVRSNIDVTTYQIGGVRPSYPAKGQVYAMVESGYITSLQIYSGTGWENVDGRIWTGSRWIPASSYNVITLQDMYDIADATPDYEYIYTESGFWDWWQRSWTDFVDKFFGQKGSGSSGAAGSIPADVLPAVPDDESTEEADGWNVLDLVVVMKDGAWSVITGVVTTAFDSFGSFASGIRNIGNFFAVYDRSNPTCITGMCDYGGDDIWA